MEDILTEAFWKDLYADNRADPELQGVLLDSETIVAQVSTDQETNQELHGTVYEQGLLSLDINVVFEHTTTSVQVNVHDTVAKLKRTLEEDLGISKSKQVLSFKSTVLQDDTRILSIPGIANDSHIELTICDDDPAQWSTNKRVKLMLKDRSLETMADTLDGVKSEISKRMVLLSNGKELRSDADYKALLLSGNAELELIFSASPTAPATTYAAAPTFTDASASSLLVPAIGDASASGLVPAYTDASASSLLVPAIGDASASGLVPAYTDASASSLLVPAIGDASASGLAPAYTDASLVPAFTDASPVPAFTAATDSALVPPFTDVIDASLVPAFTDAFTGATDASLVPAFTDASASATLPASSSQAAAKQPLKLGGQGTENNPATVSIFVELNEGILASVLVMKLHKVSVLRDILAEEQKNHPTLAALIPEHYLFTKEGCIIVEDISFLRNSVKHGDTIRIVSQPGEVGPPENDGKLIKVLVSRRTSMSTNKMVMEILSSKTAGAIKVELAKRRWLKELGFTIPMYYSFWLFHEQATTGHLFQLVDTTSLRLQRVQEGDTLFVVPKEPLKLKVRCSLNGRTVYVHQVKATEVVRKLREMLQRIGDEMFPLPSQAYDFEYNGERIMDEGKPFYWHHIVGDDELMIHIVPSLL